MALKHRNSQENSKAIVGVEEKTDRKREFNGKRKGQGGKVEKVEIIKQKKGLILCATHAALMNTLQINVDLTCLNKR